jgi:hypothetical protein
MRNIVSSLNSSDREIEDIFFNRPVNKSLSGSIGLVVSKGASLNELSRLYGSLTTMNQNVIMVGDANSMVDQVPLDLKLISKDKLKYSNTDEGIQTLSGCKILIVLAGKELNAAMELFVDKLCQVYDRTIVTEYSKLFNKINYEGQKLLLINKKDLLLKNVEGLNRLLTDIRDYSKFKDSAVVYFSSKQILGVDNNIADKGCIINCSNAVDNLEFVGILVSLLVDKKNPLDSEWLRYCQAAGFLYRMYQANGSEAVKKYLNDKF